MPEYFQISFIAKTLEANQQNKLQDLFLKTIHLQQGENHLIRSDYPLLQHKRVLFHTFQYDDVDYIECTISIPGSYEINSYLITNIISIDDMKQSFLSRFPLYFTQGPEEPIMHVNLKAQDIFIDEH